MHKGLSVATSGRWECEASPADVRLWNNKALLGCMQPARQGWWLPCSPSVAPWEMPHSCLIPPVPAWGGRHHCKSRSKRRSATRPRSQPRKGRCLTSTCALYHSAEWPGTAKIDLSLEEKDGFIHKGSKFTKICVCFTPKSRP